MSLDIQSLQEYAQWIGTEDVRFQNDKISVKLEWQDSYTLAAYVTWIGQCSQVVTFSANRFLYNRAFLVGGMLDWLEVATKDVATLSELHEGLFI